MTAPRPYARRSRLCRSCGAAEKAPAGGHQDDDGKTSRFKAIERELRFPPR